MYLHVVCTCAFVVCVFWSCVYIWGAYLFMCVCMCVRAYIRDENSSLFGVLMLCVVGV